MTGYAHLVDRDQAVEGVFRRVRHSGQMAQRDKAQVVLPVHEHPGRVNPYPDTILRVIDEPLLLLQYLCHRFPWPAQLHGQRTVACIASIVLECLMPQTRCPYAVPRAQLTFRTRCA